MWKKHDWELSAYFLDKQNQFGGTVNKNDFKQGNISSRFLENSNTSEFQVICKSECEIHEA